MYLWLMGVFLTSSTFTPDLSHLALCATGSAFSGRERTIVKASAVFISTGKRRADGDSRFKSLEGSRLEYKLDLKKLN